MNFLIDCSVDSAGGEKRGFIRRCLGGSHSDPLVNFADELGEDVLFAVRGIVFILSLVGFDLLTKSLAIFHDRSSSDKLLGKVTTINRLEDGVAIILDVAVDCLHRQ